MVAIFCAWSWVATLLMEYLGWVGYWRRPPPCQNQILLSLIIFSFSRWSTHVFWTALAHTIQTVLEGGGSIYSGSSLSLFLCMGITLVLLHSHGAAPVPMESWIWSIFLHYLSLVLSPVYIIVSLSLCHPVTSYSHEITLQSNTNAWTYDVCTYTLTLLQEIGFISVD